MNRLCNCLVFSCDPAGIQTQDLQNRNLTLYSAKLRSHFAGAKIVIFFYWDNFYVLAEEKSWGGTLFLGKGSPFLGG